MATTGITACTWRKHPILEERAYCTMLLLGTHFPGKRAFSVLKLSKIKHLEIILHFFTLAFKIGSSFSSQTLQEGREILGALKRQKNGAAWGRLPSRGGINTQRRRKEGALQEGMGTFALGEASQAPWLGEKERHL